MSKILEKNRGQASDSAILNHCHRPASRSIDAHDWTLNNTRTERTAA